MGLLTRTRYEHGGATGPGWSAYSASGCSSWVYCCCMANTPSVAAAAEARGHAANRTAKMLGALVTQRAMPLYSQQQRRCSRSLPRHGDTGGTYSSATPQNLHTYSNIAVCYSTPALVCMCCISLDTSARLPKIAAIHQPPNISQRLAYPRGSHSL
jgi:hypothetical protein